MRGLQVTLEAEQRVGREARDGCIEREVRIFPDEASCLRLITALAAEQSEEWQERRDLDLTRDLATAPRGEKADAAG